MDSELRVTAIRGSAKAAVHLALAHNSEDASTKDLGAIDYHLDALLREIDELRTALYRTRMETRATLDTERDRMERRLESDLGCVTGGDLSMAFDPHGFFVYCLWGDDDATPLYVGESANILGRLGTHLNEARKRSAVTRVTLLRCGSSRLMHDTEARLIRRYQPSWNLRGVVACR